MGATLAIPAPIAAPSSGFIIGPVRDYAFLILSPLIALALGLWVFESHWLSADVTLPRLRVGFAIPAIFLLQATLTHAHLVAVFYRSHGNAAIFRRHPARFVAAPVALIAAVWISEWAWAVVYVIGTWWDVYHTAAQTFGIGRIYDARAGNDPRAARRSELFLQTALYAGPLLCGASLAFHLGAFDRFSRVHSVFLLSIPGRVLAHVAAIRLAVLLIGLGSVCLWAVLIARAMRRGYHAPRQKILLLLSTTVTALVAWTFMQPMEAIFVVNVFHAVQYFAIVWWSEGGHIRDLLGPLGRGAARPLAWVALAAPSVLYGFVAVVQPSAIRHAVSAIALGVSILHFWYDGFIWSVRRKEV